MQYNSFVFIFFLIITTIFYYRVSRKYQNLVLLVFNYLFYIYFDFYFALLMFTVTGSTFILGNLIHKTRDQIKKRNFLIIAIIVNLIVLGFFKYFNFFTGAFLSFTELFGIKSADFTIKILAPLGISFYIFQTLTYVLDIYFESLTNRSKFLDYAVFASFFPTVVAGPIERASRMLPQIESPRSFNIENLKYGFELIVIGLLRKVLIGDTAGLIVNQIFAEPIHYTSFEIFTGVILYSVQIYNDFAGYSMMARGTATILGFDIFINFKQPYLAQSVAEFWRRWHISLSTWLRDYLFAPLQLQFRNLKIWGNIIAIIITFTLCGLWHGASWTFIFWGFLHGFYMGFSLLTINLRKKLFNINIQSKLFLTGSAVFTFILVTFAWIFFRAEDFSHAGLIFIKLTEFSAGELSLRFVKILVSYLTVSFLLDYLEIRLSTDSILTKLKPAVSIGISIALLIVVFSYLISSDKAPFIYAQF